MKRLLILALLCGCQRESNYCPPTLEIPSEWNSPVPPSTACGSLWWKEFQDPLLDSLIEQAACQNLDVAIAQTRLSEARLQMKGVKAAYYPRVDGSLAGGHAHLHNNILKKCVRHDFNYYEAGFDAEWEIDIFGKGSYEKGAALARYESAEESLADIQISLTAEIVRTYIELRGYQARLNLLDDNIASLLETHQLTEELVKIGVAAALDLNQVEEQLSLLRAEKPNVKSALVKTFNKLDILLGQPPGGLLCELSQTVPLPELPLSCSLPLPAELINKRPDVRKAERELAAACEEIGVAYANLYPRLSLRGFIGTFKGSAWFAGPDLLFPLLNSRAVTQDIELNKIKAEQALYNYQKIVYAALEETENALTFLNNEKERYNNLAKARESHKTTQKLIFDLYQRGVKDFMAVETSTRALITAEDAALQSQINLLTYYIALQKALAN